MEDFENKAIASFDGEIDFWQRYVDDVISEHDEHDSERLLSHLNSQHEKIKFTREPEKDGKLPALDVLLLRNNDGALDTKVYRKPTHSNQYMNFNSSQPLQHKLGVIRTLNHRADTNVTRKEDRLEEKKLIQDVLAVNDYPEWTHKWSPEEKPENPFHAQAMPLTPEKDMWRCRTYQVSLSPSKGCSDRMVYKLMPNHITPSAPWWSALRTAHLPRNELTRSTISRVPPATPSTLEKVANLWLLA